MGESRDWLRPFLFVKIEGRLLLKIFIKLGNKA